MRGTRLTNFKKVVSPCPGVVRLPKPLPHCPGCHYGIILRLLGEVLEELDIAGKAIGVAGGGCSTRWMEYLEIDTTGAIHGPGIAVATGIKRVHPEAVVFTFQGDGEIGAIGLGAFVAAMMRGERITTLYLNNACYGLTGGHMAPTTLLGMRTPTTPQGRDPYTTGFPFHGAELAAGIKGTAYAARVSVHTPAQRQQAKKALTRALTKQIQGVGFGLVEFLSACPPNWHLDPVECLNFIQEKMIAEYPLGEFKNVDRLDY